MGNAVNTVSWADEMLVELTGKTAFDLEQRALVESLAYVNERDHLQRACVAAAKESALEWQLPSTVSTQHTLSIAEWPRLGGFDLAFRFDNGLPPVLVELKCGQSPDALGPCVWDAAKLAFALQRNQASAAYLLAGAPSAHWEKRVRGCEFLDEGSWEMETLRDSFEDWWRHWEKQGDPQPTYLPAAFQTVALGRFPFRVAGELWELRLSRVVANSELSLPWARLLETEASE